MSLRYLHYFKSYERLSGSISCETSGLFHKKMASDPIAPIQKMFDVVCPIYPETIHLNV